MQRYTTNHLFDLHFFLILNCQSWILERYEDTDFEPTNERRLSQNMIQKFSQMNVLTSHRKYEVASIFFCDGPYDFKRSF